MHDFVPIQSLQPNTSSSSTLGINFNDSTQPVNFSIEFNKDEDKISASATVRAHIGELMRSVMLPESLFITEQTKLKGMNEHVVKIAFLGSNRKIISQKVFESANVALISSEADVLRSRFHPF